MEYNELQIKVILWMQTCHVNVLICLYLKFVFNHNDIILWAHLVIGKVGAFLQVYYILGKMLKNRCFSTDPNT